MISNYKEPINLMIHFKTIPNGTFPKVSEREREKYETGIANHVLGLPDSS